MIEAVSLPVGGFANIQWQGNDYVKWKHILSKLYARKALTERQHSELTRLRRQYGIDKFYSFKTKQHERMEVTKAAN